MYQSFSYLSYYVKKALHSVIIEGTSHMYTEDDLSQLSALQNILFCERQCALIHVEQVWSENRFTAEGGINRHRLDKCYTISVEQPANDKPKVHRPLHDLWEQQ